MSSTTKMLLRQALIILVLATPARGQAKPDCQDKCGNVSIPYPFGTRKGCYHDETFLISCNQSSNGNPKVFLQDSNINITNISLDGQLYVLNYIAHDCYDSRGTRRANKSPNISLSNFRISGTKNKFTGIGCDTYAYIEGYLGNKWYQTGCISRCASLEYATNGSCSGVGCCQTPIPQGLKSFKVTVSGYSGHKNVWDFNPCSYAFVVEEDKFNFSSQYLEGMQEENLPLVLDWAIGNVSCEAAIKSNNYACRRSISKCYDVDNGSGYRCSCLPGYEGNPYLPNGCQDIDECKDSSRNVCKGKENCINKPGSYKCTCPKGYRGDGGGNGCIVDELLVIVITIGTAVSFIVLLVSFFWLYIGHKKTKIIKLKEKFFRQNGGLLLQQKLAGSRGANETPKIFSAEELEKATNNYNESRIIGKGGSGIVYKGVLADNRTVAIKKSQEVNQTHIEQFINEVVILSQINHRNVVKILGCCLETPVPLLVYEFITNGTLSDHIYHESKPSTIAWEIRLKVASETAGVLSYLHSAASTPIVHRDIKPSNILLDDNYTAKVSDFGASRLVPLDQDELSTLVQGTVGYLDPEYLQTSQLTEKSDVYSFGVVLVELLTGKKAFCFERPEKERNLAMYFLSSLKDDRLFHVFQEHITRGGNTEQLMKVAKLAKRCLRVKGEERPTMMEVAMELEGIRSVERHPWVYTNFSSEETDCLLAKTLTHHGDGGSSSVTTNYGKEALLELDGGR